MSKISNLIRVVRSKSPRYIAYRGWHTLQKKTGLLEMKFPTELKEVSHPSLSEWRSRKGGYFFDSRERVQIPRVSHLELKEKAQRMLKGDVLFFSKAWKPLGLDYDWVTNPETGFKYDNRVHWSKIESLSKEAGDIKFVWEKSRFSWLLTICRYDYHFEEDHAEFVFSQILDWIEKNPLNCGPNYVCSQETSIRINNWLFALHFYKNSPAVTEERWNKIITSIYWQTEHVYHNINFSLITVRNNHAITETLTLYLMGLMFPTMPHAAKWKRNGKRWFEEEVDYQTEDDGTYIQDSMNYQRVVIQLLTYAIALADAHGETFNDVVYEKTYKQLNFLYQCQEPSNGWLPNYGANDGALFFPLSDTDYRDYRPQLDALHRLLTDKPLYGDFSEDALWVGGGNHAAVQRNMFPKIEKQYGLVSFERGGYYLIREKDTLTFIRCGLFKKNGSTDQLHVDVWYKGENVLMDGGSYLYNTDDETVRYFRGTQSHNTIMLGDNDQMKKGPRFMWFYPPTIVSASLREEYFDFLFEGKIIAFKHVSEGGVTIRRQVKKIKGNAEWEVTDIFENAPEDIEKRQLWHTKSDRVRFESTGDKVEKTGWYSDYYGVREPARQIELVTKDNKIVTKISITE